MTDVLLSNLLALSAPGVWLPEPPFDSPNAHQETVGNSGASMHHAWLGEPLKWHVLAQNYACRFFRKVPLGGLQ